MKLHVRSRQRGAGALIVVLVLFFIMALVAAYSSRNMIFEQKTSANQYRSTQAFEAAESGVEWALAMLNGGRISDLCLPSTDTSLTSFRQRYLDIAPDGMITRRNYFDAGGAERPLNVRCVRADNAWSCSCPLTTAPVLAAPVTADPAPAFQLRFDTISARPGVVKLVSQGCTRLIDSCLTNGTASGGDATAAVETVLALKGGLSTPPSAALTARSGVTVTGAMRVVNTDASTAGITTHIGGVLNAPNLLPQTLPGSPPEPSLVDGDQQLLQRPTDLMFSAYFGMTAALYQRQPAAITLTCPASCGAAALATAAQLNPGRVLWLNGNVTLDANVDIGTPTSPVVMVVVNGDLQSTASPRIYGLVYVDKADWATSGTLLIQGAAIANDAMSGAGSPAIVFDPNVLRRLRTQTGSFARVPGGWRDF